MDGCKLPSCPPSSYCKLHCHLDRKLSGKQHLSGDEAEVVQDYRQRRLEALNKEENEKVGDHVEMNNHQSIKEMSKNDDPSNSELYDVHTAMPAKNKIFEPELHSEEKLTVQSQLNTQGFYIEGRWHGSVSNDESSKRSGTNSSPAHDGYKTRISPSVKQQADVYTEKLSHAKSEGGQMTVSTPSPSISVVWGHDFRNEASHKAHQDMQDSDSEDLSPSKSGKSSIFIGNSGMSLGKKTYGIIVGVDNEDRTSEKEVSKQPGPRQEEEDDESDTASITSSVQSVDSFSPSTDGSSISSVFGPEGAAERLVDLILFDTDISPLLKLALTLNDVHIFEAKLRRLLKDLGVNLRQEGRSKEQRHAARFVRYRARNTAHIICNTLKSAAETSKHESANAERFVADRASDESGSDDSEQGENGFQQLEEFIRSSDAIKVLKKSLEGYIRSVEGGVQDVTRPMGSPQKMDPVDFSEIEIQDMTMTNPNPHGIDMNEKFVAPELLVVDDFIDSLDSQGTPVVRVPCQSYLRGSGETIEVQMVMGQTGRCGKMVQDDFIELLPGGIDRYKESLLKESREAKEAASRHMKLHHGREANWVHRLTIASLSFATISWCFLLTVGTNKLLEIISLDITGPYLASIAKFEIAAYTTAMASYFLAIIFALYSDYVKLTRDSTCIKVAASTSEGRKEGHPLTELSSDIHVRSGIDNGIATRISTAERLFLLLFHDDGQYATRLKQLDMTVLGATTDQVIFEALRATYRSIRGKWTSKISLRTLVWIKFVHFEIYRGELVDVQKLDVIPPPDHFDYRYSPAPSDVTPPIGHKRMMHLFHNPECAGADSVCVSRFPKKLREQLKCCPIKGVNPGWGLQFVEDWDYRKFGIVTFVVFVFGSVVIAIMLTYLEKSVQDAFAVSAYMATLATISIGFVQWLLT
ncbi:uncharacterized protein RCO7_01513 [Rhynchosporium graminicola]|uniref:Uncharacterized protein n=1 Tax=Rhynchosporium graminicola TaxID=2792576 RepID=A0A1E1JZL1_9HELO|nr:uncharacterized protein RCO7_01513 [Rhynchosporium commune]